VKIPFVGEPEGEGEPEGKGEPEGEVVGVVVPVGEEAIPERSEPEVGE
jgi:hypothetical protein